MNTLYKVFAVTWTNQWSFPMAGRYGKDADGRYVITDDNIRYDIPDDAIIARVALPPVAVQVPTEEAPVSEPVTPPRPPRRAVKNKK